MRGRGAQQRVRCSAARALRWPLSKVLRAGAFSHFGMAASLGICGDVAIPKPTNPIKGQCRTGGTSNWWLTPYKMYGLVIIND